MSRCGVWQKCELQRDGAEAYNGAMPPPVNKLLSGNTDAMTLTEHTLWLEGVLSEYLNFNLNDIGLIEDDKNKDMALVQVSKIMLAVVELMSYQAKIFSALH